MKRNNWTKEETIIAFNVYCKIPFKNSSKTNPLIIKYAQLLGRSPSALNMKIGNLGRLDPELKNQGISGLTNGSKTEEEVWDEFNGNWEKLSYESEVLIEELKKRKNIKIDHKDVIDFPFGKDEERKVKTRINQSFFRSTVLASYNGKCAITGLSIQSLLIASHIVPWAKDKINRTNPRNGICLNSLHDKAFDRGLITITTDYKIKLSKYFRDFINDKAVYNYFGIFENKKILLPNKFLPSQRFLNYHKENIFIK